MDSASMITLVLSFVFSIGTAYFVSQREIAKLHAERKIRLPDEVEKYSRPILKAAKEKHGDRLMEWEKTEVMRLNKNEVLCPLRRARS